MTAVQTNLIKPNLLEMKLTLEDFAQLVTVRYDDRWKWHDWRVRGDERLNYWIFDWRAPDWHADGELIEMAYGHFRAIQARQGQLNFHSVYVEDVEIIDIVPRKNLEYARVEIVQDRVDRQWRSATEYWVGNGGASSGIGFPSKNLPSRNEAILAGAERLNKSIKSGREFQDGEKPYQAFVNKIENFISDLTMAIIQPSLF